eukprot:TRINITY_DN2009_c0_g1_i1.p1 TRINITY_DN2009_c0_g1~~TRINITY_DN2009_c0_g1_i1.p1  ORF type:complete len:241 (-),score=59.01 TRINITY_DN2009_c0_g1_i1:96-818(-)
MEYNHIASSSEEEFLQKAVSFIVSVIHNSISTRGACVIGLSGGSTPGPIYKVLFKEEKIEWDKVFFFLVDERYIDESAKGSNLKMVKESSGDLLLGRGHLTAPNTKLPLGECIADYDRQVSTLLKHHGIPHNDFHVPDLVVMGMGDDGHTASLFPNPVVPDEWLAQDKYVIHTTTDVFEVKDRITSTLKILIPAHTKVFFLKGEGKLKVWNSMVHSSFNPKRWPIHTLLKAKGTHLISLL